MKLRALALALVAIMVFSMVPAMAAIDYTNPPHGSYLTPADYPNTDLSKFYDVQIFTTSVASDDENLVIGEINRVLEERGFNTKITYNHIVTTGSAGANMYSLTLASGEVADIFFTAPWNYLWVEAAKGSWKVLNEDPDWIEKYLPATFASQDPISWAETTTKGQIVAIPGNLLSANNKYPIARFDLMEKYGFEALNSWEDWMAFMLTIAEKETPESGIFGVNASANNIEVWRTYIQKGNKYPLYNDMFFYTNPGNGVAPAFSDVQLYYETDLYRDFAHDMKTLADAGVWSQTALTNTVTAADSFANLTGASYFHNGTVFTYGERAEANEGVKVMAYDLFPDAMAIPEAYSNNNFAIPESSANPERAAMIIDLVKNDFQFYTLAKMGIEDTHWYDNDDDGKTYSYHSERKLKYDLGTFAWALRVNWDYKEKVVTDIGLRRQAMYDQAEPRIETNPTVSFIFDDASVKAEVAAVRAVADECRPQIDLGMVDDVDAYIDEFIQRMYNSGLQKIYDELEVQYADWLASR